MPALKLDDVLEISPLRILDKTSKQKHSGFYLIKNGTTIDRLCFATHIEYLIISVDEKNWCKGKMFKSHVIFRKYWHLDVQLAYFDM